MTETTTPTGPAKTARAKKPKVAKARTPLEPPRVPFYLTSRGQRAAKQAQMVTAHMDRVLELDRSGRHAQGWLRSKAGRDFLRFAPTS